MLYELDRNDVEHYLSDFQAAQVVRANGIYSNVFQDRMLMIHTLAGYCTVPRIHALRGLDAGEVSLSGDWQAHHADGSGAALDVRIQPLTAGARGKTQVVRVENGRFEGFGKSGDMQLLSVIVRDWSKAARLSYLFTDALPQGSFMSGLYPRAQNRLSVVLTRDLDNWEPHLVSATLGIGSDRSGARADLAQGGLSAPVDLASGQVGEAVRIDPEEGLTRMASHPDTGAPIAGLTLPGWEKIRETMLRIMDESSYMRVALIDFTLLEDGSLGLIGPGALDLSATQVHQPLLGDPIFAETMRKLTL